MAITGEYVLFEDDYSQINEKFYFQIFNTQLFENYFSSKKYFCIFKIVLAIWIWKKCPKTLGELCLFGRQSVRSP